MGRRVFAIGVDPTVSPSFYRRRGQRLSVWESIWLLPEVDHERREDHQAGDRPKELTENPDEPGQPRIDTKEHE